MKKAPKKALSLVTTCAMALSLANPLLIVAAENSSKNASAVVEQAASRATSSKCNLESLSVDKYTLSPAFNPDVSDYTIEEGTYNSLTIRAYAETDGSTVSISYTNADGIEKKATSLGAVTRLKYGKNVIKITVTSPDGKESKTYTITAIRSARLGSIEILANERELNLSPEFKKDQYTYEATASNTKSVLVKAAAEMTSKYNTITVNGKTLTNDGVSVDLTGQTTQVEIKITGDAGLGATTYKVNVNQVQAASLNINCNQKDAIIRLIDPEGKEVSGNGKYSELLSGKTYSLIVTKFGYVTKKQDITLKSGEQTVDINLEKAAANSLEQVSSQWTNFRNSDENMGITNTKTPRNASEANLKWKVSPSGTTSWADAASVMIEADDSIITMAGNDLYKLSKVDGHIIKKATMAGKPSFGYTPPIYVEGMIIVPLNGGLVQAFNAKTLEPLWTSEQIGSSSSQALSPIAYSDGYIYLGFWESETKDAQFACFSITDEDTTKTNETKYASWKFTQKGGFYWAGAYVGGSTVVVGTDDGDGGSEGTGHVYSLNKKTGDVVDSIDVVGDQRSSIAYDKTSGKIFFTTKAGYLYSMKLNSNGTFDKSSLLRSEKQVQCTSTPLVHNGRVYYGTGVLNGEGKMIVADATTLKTIYEVPLKGYPQASPLLSTAYEKSEGKVYIYVTYNELPGGIAVIEDAPGQTEAKVSELFDVPSDIQQYCIASPICDSNGTIYYKNDSSHIIAIENTKKAADVNVTFDADNGQEAVVKTVSEDEALDYTPEAPTKDGYVFVGWYKNVDDIKTEYKSGQKYTENTTYKAKYAHVQMVGAQARTIVNNNDKSGIRFKTKLYNDGDEIVTKGTLIIPANLLEKGQALTLDTPKVAKSVAKVLYEQNKEENYVTYLGTIVSVPHTQFDRQMTASSFVTYKDKAGNEYTVYAPYENGSISINELLNGK